MEPKPPQLAQRPRAEGLPVRLMGLFPVGPLGSRESSQVELLKNAKSAEVPLAQMAS
jgi:hypothetical protein